MSRHRKEKSRSVRIVGAVYDRPRCSSCKIVGGHRPPLQFGCFALSVTCWAHHDFGELALLVFPGLSRPPSDLFQAGRLGPPGLPEVLIDFVALAHLRAGLAD